jgi:hypothetical protein
MATDILVEGTGRVGSVGRDHLQERGGADESIDV